MATAYIEPESPWENGYNESFNGRLRDEFLKGEPFYTLKEAQVVCVWAASGNMLIYINPTNSEPDQKLGLDITQNWNYNRGQVRRIICQSKKK